MISLQAPNPFFQMSTRDDIALTADATGTIIVDPDDVVGALSAGCVFAGGGGPGGWVGAATTDLDMTSHAIVNVLDPTNSQDVATKNYVDGSIEGQQNFVEFETNDTTTQNQILSVDVPSSSTCVIELNVAAENPADPSDYLRVFNGYISVWADASGVLTSSTGSLVSAWNPGSLLDVFDNAATVVTLPGSSPAITDNLNSGSVIDVSASSANTFVMNFTAGSTTFYTWVCRWNVVPFV